MKQGTGLGIWLTILASLLLVAGLWITCAAQRWGGDGRQHDRVEETVYLILAAATTVIVIPGVFLQIRKVRALATRGVTTIGRIEKMSLLTKQGMSPTTIVYTVAGREYRVRRDLARSKVEVGGTVEILYDPQNPKRFSIQI